VLVAPGCHLCEAALDVVQAVCPDEVVVVDVAGDPALEAAYRERLPVVEVDGVERFTFFVEPDALREALARPAVR
jgi:enamine deaminase RidA (YjgF/YER057c/UK114 family)